MDGVHDLGGTNGFGAVECEHNEPTWHEDWEPIGYALAFLGAGELKAFTIDEVRHAIERMDPRHYLASTYYERIVTGTTAMFVEKGLAGASGAAGQWPFSTGYLARRGREGPNTRDQLSAGRSCEGA